MAKFTGAILYHIDYRSNKNLLKRDERICIAMEKCAILAGLIASISIYCSAEILIGPQDTEAEIEKTVELYCKGTLGNVEWQHLPIGAQLPEIVYKDGFFFNGYKKGFSANRTDDGRNVLIIHKVKPSDAGRYTCLENSETPSRREAELIAFERFPSNESCAGKYTCRPVCNELELSCEMKAHGHFVPSMDWIDSEGMGIQSSSMQDGASGITKSTIKLQVNPYVTASFTCRQIFPGSTLISKSIWTYSTPVTKEMESTFKRQNQHETDPPPPSSTPPPEHVVILLCLITAVVFVSATIIVFVTIYKMKQATKTERAKHIWHISVDPPEINTDATRYLLSKPIEIDENLVKKKFVPCTNANTSNPIHGVAAIDDEVFIMTRDGRVVEVFDLHKGNYKRHWPIGGLIKPNDMAACPIRKRIFISDWKKMAEDAEIFSFDINGKQVNQSWLLEGEKGRISINEGSKVIIADNWHNAIKQYTFTGALQKVTKAVKDKFHIWHAVELKNGNFVASFGNAKDGHQEISIFDREGHFIKSLTNDADLLNGKPLSVARSLAVDKNGNIYICDLFNGRIVVLNPELELESVLDTTSDGYKLMGPLRICVHQYNKRSWLLVADSVKEGAEWRHGRIAVWNL